MSGSHFLKVTYYSLSISILLFQHLGSGKSRILTDLIVNLMQSKYVAKKKQIKILVTGSERSIDSLMNQLEKIQNSPNSDSGKFFSRFLVISSINLQENLCINKIFTIVFNTFSALLFVCPFFFLE